MMAKQCIIIVTFIQRVSNKSTWIRVVDLIVVYDNHGLILIRWLASFFDNATIVSIGGMPSGVGNALA